MISKLLIIIAILVILYTLLSSFFFLLKDKGEGQRVVKRLSWRIGISLLLFILIFAAMAGGWLVPGSPGPINYPTP